MLNFDRYFVNLTGIFTFRCSTFRWTYAEKENAYSNTSKDGGEECHGNPNKPDHLESGVSIRVKDLNQSGEKRNPRRKMGVLFLSFVFRIELITFSCSIFCRTYAENEEGNQIHRKMVAWECWAILKLNR